MSEITIIEQEQLASEILLSVRSIPTRISGFSFLPVNERRRLQLAANLPVPFLNSAARALDGAPPLLEHSGGNAATLRNAIAFRNNFEGVANELIMVGNGLRQTITLLLSGAGNAALRIYAIAKALNREDDRALLIPYIADMQRTLGRSRVSNPPVEVVPDTPPTTGAPAPRLEGK